MSTRVRDALLDVAIVAVIVVHVGAFFVLRERQHRFDDEVREIAAWMESDGLERLAWPAGHREAVPSLLGDGLTPVLVDPDVAPQDLAVNDTSVLVTSGAPPDRLAGVLTDELDVGSLTAHRVDLERAASIPLEPGESVGEQISRPYVYAPLRDSLIIGPGESFSRTLQLAPGRYVLSAELFDPTETSAARLAVTTPLGAIARETMRLRPVVHEPTTLGFVVEGARSRPVTVAVVRQGPAGEPDTVLMHAWQVQRRETTG